MSLKKVPIQVNPARQSIPEPVHLMAYEVYCHIFGPQPALIEGWCRGGFGVEEVIAFLYARNFPREEWKARFREAAER